MKAFQNLERFQAKARFSTWLVRIALNEALCKLRKRSRCEAFSLDCDPHEGDEHQPMEIVDWGRNPEERFAASELRQILETCMETLAPPLRVVFQLRDVEGLSIEETAETLGITASAVKARLFRARLQLRNKLNKYFAQRPSRLLLTRQLPLAVAGTAER